MSTAVKEITLEQLMTDYDWAEVFGEGSGGNTTRDIDVAPPGVDVSTSPVSRTDVAEVIAAVNGENDERDWIGVFRLNDGRFLVASGGCDYTGWDCQASNNLTVCASLDDAVKYGLDEARRALLGL